MSALRRTLGAVGVALLALAVPASAATAPFDPSPVQHVTVNGASFGYRTVGQGPPLVMIMGFTGTMAEWDPDLIRRLSARHRVILFDNRGMGESADASVAGLTIESMARDTARLISELTARGSAHVLGWSMGSYIGQELALRHPSRVRRLVLAGSDPGSPRAIQAKPSVNAILNDPNTSPDQLVPILFPRRAQERGFDYIRRVPTWPGITADSFLVPPQSLAAQNRAEGPLWYGRGRGAYADLPRLDKATLVADGTLDIVVPTPNSKLVASRIPNARLRLFRHSGHAFLFQRNRGFARRVIAFLG